MSAPKRTAIYGPEPWRTDRRLVWSHWDLWLCLVAELDYGSDLAALADAIAAREPLYDGSASEAKLSHLDELAARLRDAGLTAAALMAGVDASPALRSKARTKVLRQGLYPRDMTAAMRVTPRERLRERALRGRWDRFPSSPRPWYEALVGELGERWLHENATFRLERRIEAARERNERSTARDPAGRLAARRALVTYTFETMERCDDSYGVLSPLARDVLLSYARAPVDAAGVAIEDWSEDLCELLAWERYGVLLDHETEVFANVHGAAADHAERFLLALAGELRAHRLRYEADEALQNVAHLHVARGRLTRFAPAAAALGSEHWRPIVAMAEAALARGRTDIARKTFAAADQPGKQREYLRQRCIALTGLPPAQST
jgi:hypothetical protein